MRRFDYLKLFPIALAIICMAAPVFGADSLPAAVYRRYVSTLHSAKDIAELTPFIPRSAQRQWQEPETRRRLLRNILWKRDTGPFDVRVLYQKITGGFAVLEVQGTFAESNAFDARRFPQWASIKMMKEDGEWKVTSEQWFDEALHLEPKRDAKTVAWCAQAASAKLSEQSAAARLSDRSYNVLNAKFHPRQHCLTFYLHENNNPPRHAKITLQYPESVCTVQQINTSKPGSHAYAGLKIGIEIHHNAKILFNVYDHDDPYGLQVRYLEDSEGRPRCCVDLRLPDEGKSNLQGNVAIEVRE